MMHVKAGLFPALLLTLSLSAAAPEAGVDWTDESLAPVYDPGAGFYSYAPSVVRDGDFERYWSCHNRKPEVVRDFIYYFERRDGRLSSSYPVLGPGPEGAWDSFHVCDPAVIEGEFRFQGEDYHYAMFYLGNNVDASWDNQIGVAFSNEIDGKWTRHPEPIVPFPPQGSWGVGQPAVATLDRKGRVLLFYTQGHEGTASFCREIDLSDMERPVVGPAVQVTNEGLTRLDGSPDYLNNFSIAYDPTRDRFFAVRGQRPYDSEAPSYISPRLQIISIESRHIRDGTGAWRVEGLLTPELTSHARNHNAGIERTLFGELPDPNRLRVVFTTACAAGDCEGQRPLWTYALWQIEAKLAPETQPTTPAHRQPTTPIGHGTTDKRPGTTDHGPGTKDK